MSKVKILNFTWIAAILLHYIQTVNCFSSHHVNTRRPLPLKVSGTSTYSINDIKDLSTKDAIRIVCGSNSVPEIYKYENVDIVQKTPTLCEYIIANPKSFLDNPDLAKQYGVDFDEIDMSQPAEALAAYLPVIYLADFHSEYGNLGFTLNKRSSMLVELRPELKALRGCSVYLGGVKKQGSSFTMVHSKVGFPENRPYKSIPGKTAFRFFFSPDLAMANELCLTNDAKPNDFKFFQWGTVWSPRSLEQQYQQKMWITVTGPPSIFFDDDLPEVPVWRRVVGSLPPTRLAPKQ